MGGKNHMQFPDSFFEDEIRNGFYVPSIIKRAWAAQMEILGDIAEICERHQIQWCIGFGTLLGAVRHGGYIPWDDDLDITMLRDDYNRFIAVAGEELPEGCFVQAPESRHGSARLFTTVWNGIEFPLENERLKKYHGCPFLQGIDIFPFDYAAPSPQDEELRISLVQIAWQLILDVNEENQDTQEIKKRIIQLEELLHIKLDPHTSIKEQLFHVVEGLFMLYKEEETTDVIYMPGVWPIHKPFRLPVYGFRHPVMLPFEGISVPYPAEYDRILKIMYGNYMVYYRADGRYFYPFFREAEESLTQCYDTDRLTCKYRISTDELKKAEKQAPGSPKDMIEQFMRLSDRIHGQLSHAIQIGDTAMAKQLLEISQNCAIRIGTALEQTARATSDAIGCLEEYCESAWKTHEALASSSPEDSAAIMDFLTLPLSRLSNSIKTEIVFLPWKASHWGTMEPYWKKFSQDPNCITYVIPLPWYYRDFDRSFGDLKCERELFPDYVPITDFNSYNFKNRLPDMIFIQNPYDEYNSATSIHPSFYAKRLTNYTRNLVYIPWFVMGENEPEDDKSVYNMHYYASTPGVLYADAVIVQSEKLRLAYIDFLTLSAGEDTRALWEQKIRVSDPSLSII